MYDSYARYIYEWLQNSGLSGSTTKLIGELDSLDQRLVDVDGSLTTLANKLDGLGLQLQELIAYAEKLFSAAFFFGLLWFAMQFIQKRWYTQ